MNYKLSTKGFTLIELLVVIAIIAVILAFGVTNFVGARQRAKDIKKKSELQQMKTALRLYYNDYTQYPGPATTAANDISGCGVASPPADSCVSVCAGTFASRAGCTNIYMKQLPTATDYVWSYQKVLSGDDFCLWTTLENASDPEIAKGQAKCQASCNGVAPATSYVVCAD